VQCDRVDAHRGAESRHAAREVLLRDLGGFSYEVHRAAGASHGGHREIIDRKAARLAAIDEELRVHEAALGIGGPAATVVREPGIGGTCPACGELHGSDASWCAYCGTPLTERARKHAEEATDRAIADREAAERERLAAAAPAPPAAVPGSEEPTDENKRALAEYTGRHPVQGEEATGAKPASDAPTGDLGEPVTSERRP